MKAIVYHRSLKVCTSVPVYFAPDIHIEPSVMLAGEDRKAHLWTTKKHINDALNRLNEMTADESEDGSKIYKLTGDSLEDGWRDCIADAEITIYKMCDGGEPFRHYGLEVGKIGYSKWVAENC